MKDKIGIMLASLREEKNIPMKELARGIISIPFLCKLEKGDKEVDYIVLEALFERVGKSADKIEKLISNDDYQMIYLKDEIIESLSKGDTQNSQKQLMKYKKWADMTNGTHKQFCMEMDSLIQYQNDHDICQCIKSIQNALKVTNAEWKNNENMYLCNQELGLFLIYAYLMIEIGELEKTEKKLRQGCRYLEKHYTDGEELVKVYPHTIWLLSKIYLQQNKEEQAYETLQKGKECLRENGSLMPMYALLEIEADCLKKMGKVEELKENRKYRDAINFLYQTAGFEKPKIEMMQLLLYPSQREYVIINYLIKKLREAKGMTQEELCEDICEQETLSRIENGKRRPSRKIQYQLLQKLGMVRESYYGFIVSEDYSLYEKVREMKRYIAKNDKTKSNQLLLEIKQELNIENIVNKQFIEFEELSANKSIQGQERIKEFKRILQYTMPAIDGKNMIYRIPFRGEYACLNGIAIAYREQGNLDEAIQIYQKIEEQYKNSGVGMKYHVVPAITFYINYVAFLEVNNMLNRAIDLSQEGLQFSITNCRTDITGTILANCSCIYEKEKLRELEEKYLRYSYYFLKLYPTERTVGKVKKVYYEKYNRVL